MSAVTHSGKRYVFECHGCGLLFDATRSDAVTCSPACRVAWHRNPIREPLTAQLLMLYPPRTPARTMFSGIGRAAATKALRPDWSRRVKSGEVDDDDPRLLDDVYAAFIQLVMREVAS